MRHALLPRLGALLLLAALALPAAAQAPPTIIDTPNTTPGLGDFGGTVASVPDIDGDGHDDFVVGARVERDPSNLAVLGGRAYVFSGATATVLFKLGSPNPESVGYFGGAVAGVPDATGDGVADIIVGAASEDADGVHNAGRVYLFSGYDGVLVWTYQAPTPVASGSFGRAVAGVPDATGDGLGDILIGDNTGRVYLYRASSSTPVATLTSPNPSSPPTFGLALAGIPDVNGDGRGDLVVGAASEGTVSSQPPGRAYIFSGDDTAAPLFTLESQNPETDGRFGVAVAATPDVTGDGVPDVLIGSQERVDGVTGAGRIYLFDGRTGTFVRAFVTPVPEGSTGFGRSVAAVPDVTGDGRAEVLAGAPSASDSDGQAYLFDGSDGRLLRVLPSPNPDGNGLFGSAVAGIADADGLGRLLIGSENEDGTGPRSGRAYLYTLAPTVTATLVGAEGWRLLAPPVASSGAGLFSGIRTQGARGAQTSTGDPNVFLYDETATGSRDVGYAALADFREGLRLGRGYAVYVFADDDPFATGQQGDFPKTLTVAGFSASGSDVSMPVSYTDTGDLSEDGWNLVGNPFPGSLDWDVPEWTKTNLDNTFYVYDPSDGTYKTWNGTAGGLGDGLVAPFQGFWVKAFDTPVLTAPAEAESSDTPPVAAITAAFEVAGTVDGRPVADQVFVTFHEESLLGLDRFDGYELAPFTARYVALYAEADATALDITSLPPLTDSVEVRVGVLPVGGAEAALTLRWPDLSSLPAEWSLTLRDTETGAEIDLRTQSEYAFSMGASGRTSARTGSPWTAPPTPRPLFTASEEARTSGTRFVLSISSRSTVATEDDAASAFGITEVRPNPLGGRGVVVVRQAQAGPARLAVYDALGREVAVLADGALASGRHEMVLDPSRLAAGVYVVRWEADGRVDARTVTVLR